MTFVDLVTLTLEGGHGGNGCRSFRREKFVPLGGPDGGRGGDGGHVILKATSQLQSLMDIKLKTVYKARYGLPGRPKQCSGAKGDDLVLPVPVGTIIFDEARCTLADLCHQGEHFVVCQGGKGGLGNKSFKNSRNQAPDYCQPGLPGEKKVIQLELRMIAEVGLIGLPNAGKSTLLQALTHANPKISNYPFTTLSPNLGKIKSIDQEILVADIPGLINGASEGAGLGHDFLRHISRTRFLVHLVPADEDASICLDAYHTIIHELKNSPFDLLNKKQFVVISKIDLISLEEQQAIVDAFRDLSIDVLCLSSYNSEGIQNLINMILTTYQQSDS